ncbi:MAG: hypothetical protein WKF43_06585 [Acidimicrobiales bacterium]
MNFNPVGQIVGRMGKVRRTKDVIFDLVEETIEASDRLGSLFRAEADAETGAG